MTFLRYICIQLLAYGIDMGMFLLVLKTGVLGPILANIFAKITAGILAFFVHRNFTFHDADKSAIGHQATLYFLLLTLNVPIASAILAFLMFLFLDPVAAKFLADVVCVALTYGLSKHYIFTGQQSRLSGSISGEGNT